MNNNDGNENRKGDDTQQQGSFGVGVNQGIINNTGKLAGTIIENQTINNPPPEKTFKPIKYIPKHGSANFVGRQDELEQVHEKLCDGKVVISAVSGMGGVGKTELAIQYAKEYENDYPGGICWLNARGGNLATEIIQFIQERMELKVPQKDFQGNARTVEEQVAWCWEHWRPPEGLVLVILDDVTDLEDFS